MLPLTGETGLVTVGGNNDEESRVSMGGGEAKELAKESVVFFRGINPRSCISRSTAW